MLRLCVAFVDGTVIDRLYPNHELEEIELMVKETEEELIIRIEIEDNKGSIIHQYKRKSTYVY